MEFYLHTKEEMTVLEKMQRLIGDASQDTMPEWTSAFEVKPSTAPAAAPAAKSNPFEKPVYVGPPDPTRMRAASKKVQPLAPGRHEVRSGRVEQKE